VFTSHACDSGRLIAWNWTGDSLQIALPRFANASRPTVGKGRCKRRRDIRWQPKQSRGSRKSHRSKWVRCDRCKTPLHNVLSLNCCVYLIQGNVGSIKYLLGTSRSKRENLRQRGGINSLLPEADRPIEHSRTLTLYSVIQKSLT
jgi:hypothetical protein